MAESIIDDELLALIELLLPLAQAEKLPVSGAQTCCRSSGADWDLVCRSKVVVSYLGKVQMSHPRDLWRRHCQVVESVT